MDSPNRLIVLLTFAFLLGVVASGAGYWVVNSTGKSNHSTYSASPEFPIQNESTNPDQSVSLDDAGFSDTPLLVVNQYAGLESFDSAFERGVALHNFLGNLGEEQVSELLAQSKQIFSSSERDELRLAGIQRLAQLNPKLAVSRVLEMDQSGQLDLVGAVFKEWAHSNLDEAVSEATTLEEWNKEHALAAIVEERTDLSDDTLQTIARKLGNEQAAIRAIAHLKISEAMGDPERAWNEMAVDLQHDLQSERAIFRVAKAWVEQSGLSVLEHVSQSLTNPNTRLKVVREVLIDAAGRDPVSAFSFALSVENDQWNSTIRNVSRIWAQLDPQSALAAAFAIEKMSVRRNAEESVLNVWAGNNPRAVLGIIDALPEHLQSTATTYAVRELSKHTPEEAAKYVAGMESGRVSSQVASLVAGMWAQRDHEAALAWVLNEPNIEEVRPSVLPTVLSTLVQVDPQLAMDTALAQPIETVDSDPGISASEGIGMEQDVIASLVYSDLDKAIELLPQVREGPTRTVAYMSVASALVSAGDGDRAFSIAKQISNADRESFYMSIASAWAGHDPEGLLNSMDRFPTSEFKSKVALLLISRNGYSTELSDDQVEKAKNFLTEEDAKALAASGSE